MSSIRPLSPGAARAAGTAGPRAQPEREDTSAFTAALTAGGAGDRRGGSDGEAPPRAQQRNRAAAAPGAEPEVRRGRRLDIRL